MAIDVIYVGSAFCADVADSMVMVSIFYHDMKMTNITELEAFSLFELLIQLSAIAGVYFGFSMLAFATLLTTTVEWIRVLMLQQNVNYKPPLLSDLEIIIE